MKFRLNFLTVFLAFLVLPLAAMAQPTPGYTTNIIEGTGLEYIEYGGTITMYGDSTGSHYSNPFSINRIAGQAGTLRVTTSNPQYADSVDVRIKFHTSYNIAGTSNYTATNDSTDVSGSTTAYLTVGAANGEAYNTAYWAVVEADGLTTSNWDSTSVDWVFRGYRPVGSTHPGQVKN